MISAYLVKIIIRPETQLPQSRTGGQEQCRRRSLAHLDRSSRLKKLKNDEKVLKGTNRPTDQPTDRERRTDIAGCGVALFVLTDKIKNN